MKRYLSVFILTSFYLLFSNSAQAVIGPEPQRGSAGDYTAPAIMSNILLSSDGVSARITWTDPPDSDFYKVEILRNDGIGTMVTGDVRGMVLKGVQLYEDRDVRSGVSYLYRFRVSDVASNTRLSEEYAVQIVVPASVPSSTVVPISITPEMPAATETTLTTPASTAVTETAFTPAYGDLKEELRTGIFAYGFSRVRTLSTEQGLARALAAHLDEELPGVFNRLFHQTTVKSKSWWYGYVNAYVYGGYTLEEITRAVKLGGKVVHQAIPAFSWRDSADYKTYINP